MYSLQPKKLREQLKNLERYKTNNKAIKKMQV